MKVIEDGGIILVESDQVADEGVARLDEAGQRELLLWLNRHRSELMREIFCEDCPEALEYKNYCENKVERK